MSRERQSDHVRLIREAGFQFRVRFDRTGVPDLLTDESPPIGNGEGPSPSDLLAAAVGNCLAASLLFCLTKARVSLSGLEVQGGVDYRRDEAGRLRIEKIQVRLTPQLAPEMVEKTRRCAEIFEDFCLVTQAVRHRVPVEADVEGLA